MLKYAVGISFLFFQFFSFAQLIPVESVIPPGTDWRQMETDTVRVVYPDGLQEQASRIGGIVHYMAKNHNYSLGDKINKVDIFLWNRTVVSNGYVRMPPFHSKFFTQAPQSSFAGTTDWLDLLTIHEYRHVLQLSNARRGITKWLYYIFGEFFWTGAAHLAAPPWFWEGDAIVQETLLTHSGRGTVPGFGVYLNTIADLEKPFSYEKMVAGSYKDVIPNHYYLGYELSLFGRTEYGNDFWRDIYKDASSFKGLLWPFSRALRSRTGLRTPRFYKKMMADKQQVPSQQMVRVDLESEPSPRVPTSYRQSKFRNNDKVIVIKEDFNRAAWFTEVSLDGTERKIIPVGYGMGTFDAKDSLMVWSETTTHHRWNYVSFSNIFTYNFNSGKTRQLTDHSRYFAPALSPDKKRVMVVETDDQMNNFLTFLDTDNGTILQKIESPGNGFITFPCWLDGEHIVLVSQKHGKQSILKLNPGNGAIDTILASQHRLVEYLSCENGKLYYSMNGTNYKNQLICVDIESKEQRSSDINLVPYLMEMPSVSGNGMLTFINTSFNQKTLVITKADTVLQYESTLSMNDRIDQLYNEGRKDYALIRIAREEGGKLPESFSFPVQEKKYRPGLSKLKLHSWILLPGYPNLSMMFQANDALGKVGIYVQPGYNLNENAFFTNVNFSYGGYYPKFDLGLSTLLDRRFLRDNYGETDIIEWNELQLNASVQLPISFTRRNYFYRFSPVIGYRYIQTYDYWVDKPVYHAALAEFSFAVLKKSAYRSLKPKLGVVGAFSVQKLLNREDLPVVSADLDLYFPGFISTHSSYVEFDLRYQELDNEYYFLNTYNYAGGFTSNLHHDVVAGAKVYYAFPVWYPDIAVGPFAFFKRLRMDVNYKVDLFGENGIFQDVRHTIGINVITDARYFRLADLPVGFGIDISLDNFDIAPVNFRLILGSP